MQTVQPTQVQTVQTVQPTQVQSVQPTQVNWEYNKCMISMLCPCCFCIHRNFCFHFHILATDTWFHVNVDLVYTTILVIHLTVHDSLMYTCGTQEEQSTITVLSTSKVVRGIAHVHPIVLKRIRFYMPCSSIICKVQITGELHRLCHVQNFKFSPWVCCRGIALQWTSKTVLFWNNWVLASPTTPRKSFVEWSICMSVNNSTQFRLSPQD